MKKIIEEYTLRNTKNKSGIYEQERGELFSREIGTNKDVLDLGARHGSLTKYYIKDNRVTGVDLDEKNLEILKNNFGCKIIPYDLNEDLYDLGIGRWDVVVMSEVLEHLFYPEKKVEQISKLIKKDGLFIGSVPNNFTLKNRIRLFLGKPEYTAMAEPTHVFHFSHRILKNMLEKYFSEIEILPMQRKKYMFLANTSPNFFGFLLVFICRKPINH